MDVGAIILTLGASTITGLLVALFWAFQTYVKDELDWRKHIEERISKLRTNISDLKSSVSAMSVQIKTSITDNKNGRYANKMHVEESFDNLNKKLDAEIRVLRELIEDKENESKMLKEKIKAIFEIVDRVNTRRQN